MKKVVIGLFVGMFLVLILWTILNQPEWDRERIQQWAGENNVKFVKVEQRILHTGPFWYKAKHQRIWTGWAEDGRVYWFRIGTLEMEMLQE